MANMPSALQRWLAGKRVGPLPARNSGQAPPKLSFEFFPPRTEALEEQLWVCIRRLQPLRPRFVSVTYGAGGTTHARTHATVSRLARETDLVPAAHLTCVGATRAEVDAVARTYWEAGVRHIVALVADFEISVAAYPETHPAARSASDDLDNLAAARSQSRTSYKPDVTRMTGSAMHVSLRRNTPVIATHMCEVGGRLAHLEICAFS